MLTFRTTGDWKNTFSFLDRLSNISLENKLKKYAEEGVAALASATPVDTGKTADSWTYDITRDANGYSITWHNTNVNRGVNIALLIQNGHGTGTGGYVRGYDYINPALRPLFDSIADKVYMEVTGK